MFDEECMPRLILATTNAGKVIEIQSAIGELLGWTLASLPPGIPSIEEDGDTFVANAILKAQHYRKFVDDLTLADDSGLCVAAMGGRPGVHSARYAPDPPSRIRKILGEMQSVPNEKRNAVFYCALALARSGKIIWTAEGHVEGVIAHTPAGT